MRTRCGGKSRPSEGATQPRQQKKLRHLLLTLTTSPQGCTATHTAHPTPPTIPHQGLSANPFLHRRFALTRVCPPTLLTLHRKNMPDAAAPEAAIWTWIAHVASISYSWYLLWQILRAQLAVAAAITAVLVYLHMYFTSMAVFGVSFTVIVRRYYNHVKTFTCHKCGSRLLPSSQMIAPTPKISAWVKLNSGIMLCPKCGAEREEDSTGASIYLASGVILQAPLDSDDDDDLSAWGLPAENPEEPRPRPSSIVPSQQGARPARSPSPAHRPAGSATTSNAAALPTVRAVSTIPMPPVPTVRAVSTIRSRRYHTRRES